MPDTDAPTPVPTVRSLKQWGVAKETRGRQDHGDNDAHRSR